MNKQKTGTREWSAHSVNCISGCSNGCLYCYGRSQALRFKRIKVGVDWIAEQVREKAVKQNRYKKEGTIMFPTTHDITENNLGACRTVLKKLLKAGNQVLIVSKPSLECVGDLTRVLDEFKDQILFRFTIGALDDRILKFWEPNATSFSERRGALRIANARGFQTSVSCEPLLEPENVQELVNELDPYVTDTIWIGCANKLPQRTAWCEGLPGLAEEIARIHAGQEPERIREIYELLKDNPKIRWKDSYKKVLGMKA